MTDPTDEHEAPSSGQAPLDEQTLARVFSENRERLWRTVSFRLHGRLQTRVDPDDVLQEAYLAAVRRLDHYDGSNYPSPFLWLRAIVKQTLIDLHRHHMGARMRDARREITRHVGGYPEATSISLAAHLVGDNTSPSSAAVRHDLVGRIEEALEAMDPTDREVLALRHFEELTNAEAAEELGIQQKAASIRYVRALRRLKQVLAQIPGFFDEETHALP